MLRFFSKISLILTLTLAAFNVVAHVVGTAQPPNAILTGFSEGCEGKSRLCWYGIVPGVTSVVEANQILKRHNFILSSSGEEYRQETFTTSDETSPCGIGMYLNDLTIEEMAIWTCNHVQFGDLVTIFGTPKTITGVGIVTFEDKHIWIELPSTNDKRCWNVDPHSPIGIIRFVPQQTIDNHYEYFQREPAVAWKGMLPFERYIWFYNLQCRPNF